MKCSTCGMSKSDNPAHSDSYDGTGKHSFKGATKSADEISLVDDTPIIIGGELKALGNGKIGGWAIIFSDSKSPDLTNDYFDSKTDYFLDGETKAVRPILYDHGLDPTLKARKLGRGTLEIKDAGVWFEAELGIAEAYDNEYLPHIQKLADMGKLGVSTGSAPHMIEREQVGKSMHIKSWPIVEISLTPKPIEPRTKKSMSLKSYADESESESLLDSIKGVVEEEREDEMGVHEFEPDDDDPGECKACGISMSEGNHASKKALATIIPHKFNDKGDGTCATCDKTLMAGSHNTKSIDRPMKGMLEEELAEQEPSVYRLDSARDSVLADIASAASTQDISGAVVDIRQKVTELGTEYIARWIVMVADQIQRWVDEGDKDGFSRGPENGKFYLRSFQPIALSEFIGIEKSLVSGVNLDEHSDAVVSAVKELATINDSAAKGIEVYAGRVKKKIEFRAGDTKSGRTISKATAEKLAEARGKLKPAIDSMTAAHDHLQALEDMAQSNKGILSDADMFAIKKGIAMQRHSLEMGGIPLTSN